MKKLVNLTALTLFFLSMAVYPSLVRGQTSESPEANVIDYAPASKDVLGLTPEQKAKLEEFRKSRREEQRAHLEKMRKLRQEMRELIQDPESNEKGILDLYEQMSRLRAERFRNSLRDRNEFRKILTPEQLEKLDNLKSRMGERRNAMRGRFRGQRGMVGPGRFPRQGRMSRFWGRGGRFGARPLRHWWWRWRW
ncbi:MAG: Spy/CpxP family protein refolding chaperone [Candidatus Aminicenantes bacterium]|nr:Spy/CpxP family protein refolding chaperone [Candidatus Aminicenantes bacterium]